MKSSHSAALLPPPVNLLDEDWIPTGAIPKSLRAWGYFPDTGVWHPGDVVLTKSGMPDWVSEQIRLIQEIGYGAEAAVWTHAAVYLGDGLVLCEAQLDPSNGTCEVQIAKLWDYIGSHDLLVRRSSFATTCELGWAIATAAASKIGATYDWKFIVKLATDKTFLGEEVFTRDQTGKVTPGTYVCSSLYSTAHAYVTDVSVADKTSGICVPAHLALSSKLNTIKFHWRRIAGTR